MYLQPWLTGHRMFGVSNRHTHRCNILQSGCEITGHTSQHVLMSLLPLQWSSGYRGVLSRVYDIESDGGVSSVPALAGEMVTVYGPSIAYRPSSLYGPSVVYGPPTKYGPSSVYSKPKQFLFMD